MKNWIPLAILSTIFSGLVYLAVQQDLRSSANDPQIQIAEDAAVKLADGQPPQSLVPEEKVDIAKSLVPYIIIYDDSGKTLYSSAELNGQNPQLPSGVFSDAKTKGELRFTWQPQQGARNAVVMTYFNSKQSGYVLAGRSLREMEIRESNLLIEVIFAWLVSLVCSFIAIVFLKMIVPKK